ncbi:MAG: molybdopterin-dependent oxidoreductase, partial [Methylobacteriaceae bacterium]|nr:molybdopterin-dependent oxidoreductase [Methylobacteriaceae bacterium]
MKADLLGRPEGLLVLGRPDVPDPDLHLAIGPAGDVTAFNGHVDLGTGIRTALAQIVAEELDVAPESVALVLGHTGETPDQGPTIASETIQVAAVPLRQAAATARQALLELAGAVLGADPATLAVEDGLVRLPGTNRQVAYRELLRGRRIVLALDPAAPLKPPSSYRTVGRATPRADIPAKAAGRFTYVHDVQVPGMLHGRVVRPPYAGRDAGPFVGRSLVAIDDSSVAGLAGLVAIVREGDFVGLVCERED